MIRFATEKDIPKIGDLLRQVCLVHHNGRPDIFNVGRKYTAEELAELVWNNLNEDNKVSLFVRTIPLDGGEPTEIIINKNK